MPVSRADPSLPVGYQRLWDRKLHKYVYRNRGQIVPHPMLPSKRINRSQIPRPQGINTPTRVQEAQLLNLSGGGVLETDIEVLTDPTISPPWQKFFDTLIRKYYYINRQEESWEHPFMPRKPLYGEVKYGDAGLPHGWDKYVDHATNTYFYYCPKTTEITWDHPNPPPFPNGLTVIPNDHISKLYTMYRDSASHQIFYFNTLTTETFWTLPHGVAGVGNMPGDSSNPIEIFACQRVNVVTPGVIRLPSESGPSESGPSESGASGSGP